MDRGAWQATVRGVAKSWTRLRNLHKNANSVGLIYFTTYLTLNLNQIKSPIKKTITPSPNKQRSPLQWNECSHRLEVWGQCMRSYCDNDEQYNDLF